jgi:hypothetical protein
MRGTGETDAILQPLKQINWPLSSADGPATATILLDKQQANKSKRRSLRRIIQREQTAKGGAKHGNVSSWASRVRDQ